MFNLIGSTTTTTIIIIIIIIIQGLHIKTVLDENTDAPGIMIPDDDLATLVIERDGFHGEWNYRW